MLLIILVLVYILLFIYGLFRKFSFKEMIRMSLKGMSKVKNILLTFLLIGMLTAAWRASGTIAVIITYCSGLLKPSIILLASFLLNAGISFLTGTSFGTVATMGVICMTLSRTMHVNPVLTAGSILSGIFFGDRCSPVSTSALLVSEVTGTDIYKNIRQMLLYGAIPFAISCLIYFLLGLFTSHGEAGMDVKALFTSVFTLHPLALLPAAVILVLSLFKVKVKLTMILSILTAVPLCLFIQKIPPLELCRLLILGYEAPVAEVGAMLNGGGLISMVRVTCIVCLSSSFSGIFEGTHMLDGVKDRIARLGKKTVPFGGIALVSIVACAISCNQSLAIILTNQLTDTLQPDKEKRAIALEDGPVVIAPLIPWSIAGAVPVEVLGAGPLCLFFACYLYLLPVVHFLIDTIRQKKRSV